MRAIAHIIRKNEHVKVVRREGISLVTEFYSLGSHLFGRLSFAIRRILFVSGFRRAVSEARLFMGKTVLMDAS